MTRFLSAEEEDILLRSTKCPVEELSYPHQYNHSITVRDAITDLVYNKLNGSVELLQMMQGPGGDDNGGFGSSPIARVIENVLSTYVVAAICLFGIIGNVMNLMILSHRSWQVALGRMERFVQSGLISLAISDLCFCISLLPMGFLDQHHIIYNSLGFGIIYMAYCDGFINTFVICSTIITVSIGVGRYFAMVNPLKAREKFGMTCAKRILLAVFIGSVIVNIPRYWFKQVRVINCLSDNSTMYYIHLHPITNTTKMIYLCIYFVVAICGPVVILAFCNIYLVKALRQTISSPLGNRRSETKHEGSYRITLSLVIIVTAFLILVVPPETYLFWTKWMYSPAAPDKYNLQVAILSSLSALNFAFNFIMYCVVNAHFRRTMKNLLKCNFTHLAKRKRSERFESASMMSSGPNGTKDNYNNQHIALHQMEKISQRKTSVTEL